MQRAKALASRIELVIAGETTTESSPRPRRFLAHRPHARKAFLQGQMRVTHLGRLENDGGGTLLQPWRIPGRTSRLRRLKYERDGYNAPGGDLRHDPDLENAAISRHEARQTATNGSSISAKTRLDS